MTVGFGDEINADRGEYLELSPYRYGEGFLVVCDNQRKNCTLKELEEGVKTGKISQAASHIIQTVYLCGVVSRLSVEQYLIALGLIDKQDIKSDIKYLVSKGIILKLRVCSDRRSTPPVYALSPVALSFSGRMYGKRGFLKKVSVPSFNINDPVEVLRLSVFNQFFLRLLSSDIAIEQCYRWYFVKIGKKESCVIDGIIRVRMVGILRQRDFAFITLRRDAGWQKDFFNKLLGIYNLGGIVCPKRPEVVVMCESMEHAKEIERYRLGLENAGDYLVYYLPDIDVMQTPVLSVLYRVHFVKNAASFEGVRLSLYTKGS